MNIASFLGISKKTYTIVVFAMLSALLVAYGPMTTYAQAQEVQQTNLQKYKDKILNELNRRIKNYEKTLASLSVDVHTDKANDGKKTRAARDNRGATGRETSIESTLSDVSDGYTLDDQGIRGNIFITSSFKEKVKQYMQKLLDGLKAMVEKVENSKTVTKLKELASNIDTQYVVNKVTQVQGAITQAVDAMNGAVDDLKTGFNTMQERLTQLRECFRGLRSGDSQLDVSISSSGSNASCGDYKITSEEIVEGVQTQMNNLGSIISTIGSVLLSVVTLLLSLVGQFGNLLSSFGSLGSFGNLANLGNESNLSGKLSGSGGSAVSSLTTSYEGVFSQLNLAKTMASGAKSSLSTISTSVNR